MTSVNPPLIPAMSPRNLMRLLSLAAIWGFSFIFMRVSAPVLGAVWMADARASIAGLALLVYLFFRKTKFQWRQNFKTYLIVGILNAALPFLCFGYAGQYLPAGYSALLNATTPLFGALLSAVFLSEKMTLGKIGGIFCGALGVGLVAKVGGVTLTHHVILAMLACLLAAACYAMSTIYIKKSGSHINPTLLAMGSQLFGGLILMPAIPFNPIPGHIDLVTAGCVLALGVLCTAVALVIFYHMIHDIGPTKASTVTFLVPMFGVLWGWLLLGEHITLPMVAGMVLILTGTRSVLRR